MSETRYPGFNVMEEEEAWDPHTRSIVTGRLAADPSRTDPNEGLSDAQSALLRCVLKHLLYEDREELLHFVVSHFEKKMRERYGEAQRKRDVPAEDQLITQGLLGLDDVAGKRHGKPFTECNTKQQFKLIHDLQKGRLQAVGAMALLPQKELFKKLLSLAAEAYASHPQVWSEMGYAGPAYPRGYYRIEQGLHDPWEPSHT